MKKQLNGEHLKVDTGCIVAFEESVNYDVEMAGGLKSMVFGGEGMFVTLRGFGTVCCKACFRLADRVLQAHPVRGERPREGSLLGGIGRMIDGIDLKI